MASGEEIVSHFKVNGHCQLHGHRECRCPIWDPARQRDDMLLILARCLLGDLILCEPIAERHEFDHRRGRKLANGSPAPVVSEYRLTICSTFAELSSGSGSGSESAKVNEWDALTGAPGRYAERLEMPTSDQERFEMMERASLELMAAAERIRARIK
jgi:hypothetical protein